MCTMGMCACNEGFRGDGLTCMPDTLGFTEVQAYLKASNTGAEDWFGFSVALSGDGNTLAVGAMWEGGSGTGVNPASDEGATQSGAVYVYRRTGTTWAFEAYLKASNTEAGDWFGWSVALSADGNTLAVGASREDGSGTRANPPSDEGATDSGAVYVYRRTGSAWAFEAYLKASNTEAGDGFGASTALSDDGNTLAVGALFENGSGTGVNPASSDGARESGAAYVYQRTGSTWAFEAYIKASNTGARDRLGLAVALSHDGNTLAIGAYGEAGSGTGVNPASSEGADQSGAVYIYQRTGATWAFEASLVRRRASAHRSGSIKWGDKARDDDSCVPLNSRSRTASPGRFASVAEEREVERIALTKALRAEPATDVVLSMNAHLKLTTLRGRDAPALFCLSAVAVNASQGHCTDEVRTTGASGCARKVTGRTWRGVSGRPSATQNSIKLASAWQPCVAAIRKGDPDFIQTRSEALGVAHGLIRIEARSHREK